MLSSPVRAALALMVAVLPASALAQSPEFRFGRVDIEDVQMESFPADSNATAVILYDYAKASFNERLDLEVEFITRIKILTEPGIDYATVRVPYYAEQRMQQVSGIRGNTYNLNAAGDVDRTSLSSRSVFHEDADGSFRVASFTMPNVQPGSVIEYRYLLRSSSPRFLPSWNFQHEEPVLWSEYIVEIPQMLEYTVVMQGLRPLAINESERFNLRRGGYEFAGKRYRYVATNLPAIREEPFMTTINNYRMRLNIQLSRIVPLNAPSRNIMDTWEKLNEDLISDRWFGRELRGSREIRRLVPDIIEGLETEIEIMKAVYDYVRETMEWDGIYTRGYDGVANAFRARKGTSADINLLLACMLREAGLEADPVILSLRSRGRVQQLYPILAQFNHVIVLVEMGEYVALLDATDKLRPFNILPVEAINGLAWRVSEEKGGWINIQPTAAGRSRALIQVRLTPEGGLTGSAEKMFADYSALSVRRALRDMSDDEYIRNRFLRQISGAVPEDFEISGKDAIDSPITVKTTFQTHDYAHAAGDFIYINWFVINRTEENPFRTPEREFPVDYGVGAQHQYVLRMEIPDGYEVHERPRNLHLRLQNDAGDFVRAIQEEDGVLSISTIFRIHSPVFAPREYRALREFYNRVVAADAEQVLLRRVSDQTSGEPADEPESEGGEQ